MEILLWLVPAAVTTLVAMVVVGWLGRERPEVERTEADQERLAAALEREHPHAVRPTRARPRERSTGVALRAPDGDQRRSA